MAERKRPYGEGTITKRKDDGYQVCVYVDAKPVYRQARTEPEAEKIRKQLVRLKQRGKLKPDPPKIRLAKLLDDWLETKRPPETTSRTYGVCERHIRLRIAPSLGHLRAADLKPTDVDAWLALLAKRRLATRTIAQARGVLSAALDWGVDREMLSRNPAKRIRAPKGRPTEPRMPPDIETARVFLAAVSGHRLAALWHLAAYLGLRRGELLGLTWAAVDLDAATLTVNAQLIREEKEWTLPAPKSRAGTRTLPLTPHLVEMLTRRRRDQLAERVRAREWGPDLGLVFTGRSGQPVQPGTVLYLQRRLTAAAEVADVEPHRFRHGVATLLLSFDAPDRIIKAFLGHEDRSVSGGYQHPTVAMLRPYAERIAAAFEGETRAKPVQDSGEAASVGGT